MATNNKNLQDNLKKYFYSGVGLAAHTADVFQKSFKELSRKGKVSEADGKRIVRDAIKKVEARRPEIEAKYNATVHQFVKVTTAEIVKLQKRIQQLEGQLKTKNTTAAPSHSSTTKRTTGKTKHTKAKRTTRTKPSPKVDSPATENRTDSSTTHSSATAAD